MYANFIKKEENIRFIGNLAGSIGLLLYQSICHHEQIEEIAKTKYPQ